jgi:hypothetical protein
MKAAYALGFLGLCAFVLVLHVYDAPAEDVKEVEDPFLASLEKHVVAVAQKRLRQRDAKMARDTHISEARKAIKASLMEAESTNMHNLQKTKLDEVTEDDKDNSSDKDDVKNDEFLEPKEQKFTWAQLQAGADVKSETDKSAMVGDLMSKLQAAPHTSDVAAIKKVDTSKTSALSALLDKTKQSTGFTDDARPSAAAAP